MQLIINQNHLIMKNLQMSSQVRLVIAMFCAHFLSKKIITPIPLVTTT